MPENGEYIKIEGFWVQKGELEPQVPDNVSFGLSLIFMLKKYQKKKKVFS